MATKHHKENYERATGDEVLSELTVYVNIVINDSRDFEEYESALLGFTYNGPKNGFISELKEYIKSEFFLNYIENMGWAMFPFSYQQKLPFPK